MRPSVSESVLIETDENEANRLRTRFVGILWRRGRLPRAEARDVRRARGSTKEHETHRASPAFRYNAFLADD